MSVVGIDFGNLQTVIAVARNRGIDVICNEVSNRATPSLVSFGPRQRYLGESAKTQEVSNFKNTVGSLKRLIGRSLADDAELRDIEAKFVNAALVDGDGPSTEVSARVQYLGEEHTFTATQLAAMFLSKAKAIASHELRNPVSDCVISVPGYFTDRERRAVLDAAEVAGLNPLRLLNDTTAAALGYGITKTDLPEEKPRHVVFVDIGHSDYGVSVVDYLKGQLTVKATAHDRHFGGRYFDELLVDHFAADFLTRYKLDVKSNSKALLRLRVGCEKLKKVLSANAHAPLNIESIMDDRDVSAVMSREEFEALAAHLFSRVEAPILRALSEAGLKVEEIDAIELVGGSTRIPAIKETLTRLFNKELSTTLNQDEAVARGCALQCAILSPVFKVRDFSVQDLTPYPVRFAWDATAEGADTELDVFARNNPTPSTKILTLHRAEPFDLVATYSDLSVLPPDTKPLIGRFTVQKVKPISGDLANVKVKARVNLHGIVAVEGAYIAEEITKEEVDEEGNTKTKKVIRKHDLPVLASSTGSLPLPLLQGLTEAENEMASADKLVADTEERKNALEEYVYEMRGKVEMAYSEYVTPADKEALSALFTSTEDWLYDEGEDAAKSVYVAKLDELRNLADPIQDRAREAEGRPEAVRELRTAIDLYTSQATNGEAKYDHIATEDKQKVAEKCASTLKWLEDKLASQDARSPAQDPIIRVAEIKKERAALVSLASPIMSKPKPAPPAPPVIDLSNRTVVEEVNEAAQNSESSESVGEMDVD